MAANSYCERYCVIIKKTYEFEFQITITLIFDYKVLNGIFSAIWHSVRLCLAVIICMLKFYIISEWTLDEDGT